MYKKYNFEDSLSIIDEIKNLNVPEFIYTDGIANFINNRNSPMFAKAACLCVKFEGVEESEIKIYACLYSEISSIMKSADTHLITQYEGNTLISIYNTRLKINIEELIDIAAKINSITEIITYKFSKELGPKKISACIGIHYGNTYFVNGDCAEGTKSIIAYGPSRNEAIKLAKTSNSNSGKTLISSSVYQNLSDSYQKFFNHNTDTDTYTASLINTVMSKWIEKVK